MQGSVDAHGIYRARFQALAAIHAPILMDQSLTIPDTDRSRRALFHAMRTAYTAVIVNLQGMIKISFLHGLRSFFIKPCDHTYRGTYVYLALDR